MYNFYQPIQQPTPTSLIRVSSIEGARAYTMAPNSVQALFHENENLMYVKSTDGAGFPTIRTFKFEEIIDHSQSNSDFVTKEDFNSAINEIKEILTNGKQFISKSTKSKDE